MNQHTRVGKSLPISSNMTSSACMGPKTLAAAHTTLDTHMQTSTQEKTNLTVQNTNARTAK